MSNDTHTQIDHTGPPLEPAARHDFDHVRVAVDGAPDECAIVPGAACDDRLERAWIAAQGTSFVDLESMA